MINILPPKEKESLRLEQTKNLVIILGFVAIVSLICLIFILLSIKYYILSSVDHQKLILQEVEKQRQSPNFAEFKDIIVLYNGILPEIVSFYKEEVYSGDILSVISGIERPEGLYFNKIYIDRDTPGDKTKVSVFGFSDTRENLLLFQKKLQEESTAKNIYFAPASWINPKDINFTFTFNFEY